MNVVSRILMVTLIVGLLQPLFAGSDMVRAADKLYGLYSFGYGANGQLGHGDYGNQLSPKLIADLASANVKSVAAGQNFSLVLLENGDVYSFGNNSFGQLGQGNWTQLASPTKIENLPSIKAIAAGATHALLLTTDGDVLSFGNNAYGQLGLGDTDNRSNPTLVPGLEGKNIAAIAAGNSQSYAITQTGELYMFGNIIMLP